MANSLWKNKLLVWLHNSAEKSLALFNNPSGSPKDIYNEILEQLDIEDYVSDDIKHECEFVDLLASSADIPQWPKDENHGGYSQWAQVDFNSRPMLIHPLTGDKLELNNLEKVDYSSAKDIATKNIKRLLKLGKDDKMKFLAVWRFVPEYGEKLNSFWNLLPADTRVPDFSVWNKLDLASAFIGARFENKKMSVLNMAFGPVQNFIAQARATSDLWAGSHLLSSMVWEGMKVIADEIGPDAFIFPQIRGLAIVDKWLFEKVRNTEYENLWFKEFEAIRAEWLTNKTDSNPLFAACLPNKFSAIVPTDKATELAEKVKAAVRKVIKDWCNKALEFLELGNSKTAKDQLNIQLEEFPQVFFSSVGWAEDAVENPEYLKQASKIFADDSDNFFSEDKNGYWNNLSREIEIKGSKFWTPNASVVYPVIYELADKSLAANKSIREFRQMPQKGFRCTLCGEREWLTNDIEKLNITPGKRNKHRGQYICETSWNSLTGNFKNEHLCAICALKRYWPKIFKDLVSDFIDEDITRYVVSTHTMSLIPTLEALINNKSGEIKDLKSSIDSEISSEYDSRSVALPRKMSSLKKDIKGICKSIPAYIDYLRELNEFDRIDEFYNDLKKITGVRPETYYALILMDGDNMGAWLSANEKERQIHISDTWHPSVVNSQELSNANNVLVNYLKTLKLASPIRHAVISQALNNFSSKIVPDIIENQHHGKLIYSGGDDVLAMAPTDQVIDIIEDLRKAYSGFGRILQSNEALSDVNDYKQNGFMIHDKRLLLTMGLKASASVGVVIVHHQTPLAYALKCLREAEHIAKSAGRNAFCIRILKRAGGEISFTDNWWSSSEKDCPSDIKENGFTDNSSIGLFNSLIKLIANNENVSRKALYSIEEWINLLPEWLDNQGQMAWREEDWNTSKDMASAMLSRQFSQHSCDDLTTEIKPLAERIVSFIWNKAKLEKNNNIKNPMKQLQDMLFCAEFFARETRTYGLSNNQEAKNE